MIKSRIAAGVAALLMVTGLHAAASADDAQGNAALGNALHGSRLLLDARLRWEAVDQEGIARNADALTARARIGFETGKAWNTALLAEASVNAPLVEDFNSTTNGRTQYPVVADPRNTVINRLALSNGSLPHTLITLGRQVINLDDQRFVGDSGWRQNQQSFDAVRVVVHPQARLTIDASFFDQVNRVFGSDSPVGRYTGGNYLLNVGWETGFGKLGAFDYLLDFDQAPRDSSGTLGLRFAGERRSGDRVFAYSGSYARQRERAGNPLDYSVDYLAAELIGTLGPWSLGAGAERLGGDGVKGFATPLATLHRFDGWDDKFLTTPPDGLECQYGTLRYTAKNVGAFDTLTGTAVYHDFSAVRLGTHYGREYDLQLAGKHKRYTALVKLANYHADHYATSTRKIWLELDYAR